uniref:Uncharacterized protein LOC105049074 isoform X1 n=1 Tax=Elaeis guineensis var. tenera TaxID=51953 RepID=A0A8N4F0J1_ELAGV|nr:uncharacterized protein LOC105049074 isoform X1 [Elaeis guineensis]
MRLLWVAEVKWVLLRVYSFDKVCDICGDIGYAEAIITCCICKKASEHIYCTPPELGPVEGLWCCLECLASHHPDAKMKETFTNQKIMQNDCSDAEEANTQQGKRLPLVETRNSKINYDKRQSSRKEKGSFKKTEMAKVKFISDKEAALLGTESKSRACNTKESLHTSQMSNTKTKAYDSQRNLPAVVNSGKKMMTYDRWKNQHVSSHQAAEGNIIPPSTYKCTTPKMSRIVSSDTLKTVTQTNKGAVGARVHLSSSKCVMTKKHVVDDKKGKIQKNKSSGDEAFEAFCIKGTMEGSADETNCKSNALSLFTKDEKMTYSALGQKCASNVEPVKTSVPDTVLGGSNDEINLLPAGGPGNSSVVCSDVQGNRRCYQDVDQPLILLISPDMKFSNCPVPDICWKGAFDVLNEDFHVCCGIQAHFSRQVSCKAYEVTKQIPKELKFKVIPRARVWPKIFQFDPPTCEDIGLYFLPSEIPRSKENYICLLEHVNSHDCALQSQIGDVKLQIYTSKQLPADSEGPASQMYLWGIFCHVKHKKLNCDMQKQPSSKTPITSVKTCNESNNHQKGNCTEIHSTGKTISSPVPLFDPPPGFQKLRSEVHRKGPPVMSAPKDVRRSISSESPPVFPRHSPGNEGSSSRLPGSMTSLMCKSTRPTMDHQELGHAHRSRGSNTIDSNRTQHDGHYTMKAGDTGKRKMWQGSSSVKDNKKVPYDKVYGTPYRSVLERIRHTIPYRYQNNKQYRECTEHQYAERASIPHVSASNQDGTGIGSKSESRKRKSSGFGNPTNKQQHEASTDYDNR